MKVDPFNLHTISSLYSNGPINCKDTSDIFVSILCYINKDWVILSLDATQSQMAIVYTMKLLQAGQHWDRKNMAGFVRLLLPRIVRQGLKKLADIQGEPV